MPDPMNQQEHIPMQGQYQDVNYHGAIVSGALKNKLQATSASDYLRFQSIPGDEDRFIMQAKFPEKGMDENGNEYDLRININYLLRGAARYMLDENGNLDMDKVVRLDQLTDQMLQDSSFTPEKFPAEILEACQIPPERLENFKRFIAANCNKEVRSLLGTGQIYNLLQAAAMEKDYLFNYQQSLHNRLDRNTPEANAERALLLESYPDVRNIMQAYREMRDMNPLTETRLLHFTDCDGLGSQYQTVFEQNQRYRQAKAPDAMQDMTFQRQELRMEQQPDQNKMAFYSHAYSTLQIENGDEPIVISLETTAPPANRMFFRPEPTRTGVGIYRSKEALREFHEHNNVLSEETARTVIPHSEKLKKEKASKESGPKVISLENMTRDAYRTELQLHGLDPANEAQMSEQDKQTLHAIQNKYQEMMMEDARIAAESQRQKIAQMTEQYRDADIDRTRQNTKAMLALLTDKKTGSYTKEAQDDPELRAIVDNVRKYAKMDTTAVRGDYDKERDLVSKMRQQVDTYLNKQDAKMMYTESEDEAFRRRYLVAANVQHFLDVQSDGLLKVPEKGTEKVAFIDGVQHAPAHGADIMRDASDQPLFPHDPSPSDIAQGYLGDCYLIAGLSALASRYPNKIRESMVDNNNGTVTVRFYHKPIDEQTGKVGAAEPIYVTVDKKFPMNRGSNDCLWVQMIERAYAASGLQATRFNPRPVPENIDEIYQNIRSGQQPMPTHEECPWLVDEFNSLHPWEPSYQAMEGGLSGEFLNVFLGDDIQPGTEKDSRRNIKSPSAEDAFRTGLNDVLNNVYRINNVITKDDVVDPALKTPPEAWNSASDAEKCLSVLLHKKPGELPAMSDELKQNTIVFFKSMLQSTRSYIENQARTRAASVGYDKFDWKTVTNDCKTVFRQTLEDRLPEDGSISDKATIQTFRNMFISSLADVLPPEEMNSLSDRVSDALNAGLDHYIDNNAPSFQPYQGKYTSKESSLFDDISIALKNGNIVTGGTRGKSDKVSDNGIYDSHAYSVLGVSEHALYEGGPKMKFVRVRNPHGKTGRRYDVNSKTKKVTPKSDSMKDTGGIFEIELHDFCTNFDVVDINALSLNMLLSEPTLTAAEKAERSHKWNMRYGSKKNKEAQEEPAEEKQPVPKQPDPNSIGEQRMSFQKTGDLARPLRASMLALHDTNSKWFASKEYKDFYETASNSLERYFGGDMTGKTVQQCYTVFAQIADKGDAYLKHCAENPTSGSRRATRMKEVSYMTNICRAYEKGKTPYEYIQDKLASELGAFFCESQKVQLRAQLNKAAPKAKTDLENRIKALDTDAGKQKMVESVKSNAIFKRLLKHNDLKKLNDLTLSRKEAVAQMEKIHKAVLKVQAAGKPVQAAQPNVPNRQEPKKQGPSRSL